MQAREGEAAAAQALAARDVLLAKAEADASEAREAVVKTVKQVGEWSAEYGGRDGVCVRCMGRVGQG